MCVIEKESNKVSEVLHKMYAHFLSWFGEAIEFLFKFFIKMRMWWATANMRTKLYALNLDSRSSSIYIWIWFLPPPALVCSHHIRKINIWCRKCVWPSKKSKAIDLSTIRWPNQKSTLQKISNRLLTTFAFASAHETQNLARYTCIQIQTY